MANAGAASFGGTNEYLDRAALSGNADSKKFTLMMFFNRAAIGVQQTWIGSRASGSARFDLRMNASNIFRIRGFNSAAGFILQRDNSTAQTDTSDWHVFLYSGDMAVGDEMYIDDSEDDSGTGIFTDDTIDFTNDAWSVGAFDNGDEKYDGCFGPVGLWPGLHLDLTVEANRRLFHTGDAIPKLAATLNASPIVGGITPSIWLNNGFATYQEDESGNSNDFTENGTLAACTGPEIEVTGEPGFPPALFHHAMMLSPLLRM